jgi:DNA-binding CsgD family transcriptional regulator
VPNAATAYAELGDIRRRLGDLAGAEAAFTRAEELSGGTCAGAALLRLAQGRVGSAQRIVSHCLAGQPRERPARVQLLATAVQVSLAADDDITARTSLAELQVIAQTFGSPLFRAVAVTAQGRVQLAAHDIDGAIGCLRDAVQHWRHLDIPYEVATASTLLGQALRLGGDEEGAAAAFAEARALFQQIGAELQPAQVGRADAARPGGLTVREIEVLRLIAAGRSNKGIAAELHLSPKTVSRHLSNIFTKIGVSSRAAATAFAFEHRIVTDTGPAER